MVPPPEEAAARKARQQERTAYWQGEMAKSWGGGAILVFIGLALGAISKSLLLPFLILVLVVGVPWAIRQRSRE